MTRATLHVGLALVLLVAGLGLPVLAQGSVDDAAGWGATEHTIGYTHDSQVARAAAASVSALRPVPLLGSALLVPSGPALDRPQRGATGVADLAPPKSDPEQPGTGATVR